MGDLEFVRSCVKGDKGSWDEFLKTYSRLIYNYIHNVLNSKGFPSNQEHIQDIFQEIFCSLIKDDCKKLRSFKARNGCSLATWLRVVTVNFTIDYIRKSRPTISIDEQTDEDVNLQEILADDSEGIKDQLGLKESLKGLEDCIEELDIESKFFLELYINQGLGLEKLKSILGVSRGSIDMRKARIIDKLRDCFKVKGFMLDL